MKITPIISQVGNFTTAPTSTLDDDIKTLERGGDPYPYFKGYNSPLKTAFRKGALGERVYGIYGNRLTQDTVSLEHIIPASKGGKTELGNLVLADKKANNDRGTKDIAELITIGDVRYYLRQFKDIKTKYFDGNEYIKAVRKTFKKMMED